jgi:hypothetical protein
MDIGMCVCTVIIGTLILDGVIHSSFAIKSEEIFLSLQSTGKIVSRQKVTFLNWEAKIDILLVLIRNANAELSAWIFSKNYVLTPYVN